MRIKGKRCRLGEISFHTQTVRSLLASNSPATFAVHSPGVQPDGVLFPLFEDFFVEHGRRDGRQRGDSPLKTMTMATKDDDDDDNG